MPIDPNIPLQVRPPEITNPAQYAVQGASLATMMQENQVRQQQQQALQLENQERQMDLQDQQKLRQAYMESNGDMDQFRQKAMQMGVGPKSIAALNQQVLAMKKAYADADEATVKSQQAHAQRVGGQLQALLSDPKRADNWSAVRSQAIQSGDATPDQVPETYPGDDWVRMHAAAAVTADKQATLDLDRRKTLAQEQQAAARKSLADTAAARLATEQPGLTAKSDQDVRANTAPALATAAEQGKDAYARAYYQLDPKIAAKFPHPDEYDPDRTPDAVRQLGMTAEQQTAAAQRDTQQAQTARHNQAEEQHWQAQEGRERSNTQNQFLQREADKHDQLQKQEQEQWTLHQNLLDILKLKNGAQFYDPTTKSSIPLTMDDAARQRIKAEYDKAATSAMQLQQQQRNLRKRYGWGEFAPKQEFSEADVRQRAISRGIDPAVAINVARQKGLLGAGDSSSPTPPTH